MKKILCLLLAFAFLFFLVACTPTAGETSDEPGTSAPAESTAPTESGDATEPEETEPEATTPEETEPPVPNIVDGLFVWNEAQFPTIKSIKIGPNTLTNPDPTEKELSNFLCEILFYKYSFGWDGYVTPYRIPWDDSIAYFNESGAIKLYRMDPDYIKSRRYIRSIVLESYFQNSYHLDVDDVMVGLFSNSKDAADNDNIYVVASSCDDDWDPMWDPSLLNFEVTNKTDTSMVVHLYVYKHDDETAKISEHTVYMIYAEDHLWKANRWSIHWSCNFQTPVRDDFGKRLTLVKPD